MTNGTRLAVMPGTRLAIQRGGEIVELEKGSLFIQAAGAVRVEAGEAVVSLEEAGSKAVVRTAPNEPMCRVYTGRAKLTRQGRDTQLSAGQEGAWGRAAESVHIETFDAGTPDWISKALEMAGEP
jgi:hypothetical protein